MEIEKLTPIITTLRKGKQLKRYNTTVNESSGKYAPNINIGVTPSGTRYYRALLPDKSWGTTYMIRKDDTETIVDICKMSYGTKASVEKSKHKVVQTDRLIEHHTNDTEDVLNVVSRDRRVGKTARSFVQPEVHEYMFHLKKVPDYKELEPQKPQPFRRFLLKIKKLLIS